MITFMVGLVVGTALGLIAIGFLAVGAYERGYDAAQQHRTSLMLRAKASPATHARRIEQKVA